MLSQSDCNCADGLVRVIDMKVYGNRCPTYGEWSTNAELGNSSASISVVPPKSNSAWPILPLGAVSRNRRGDRKTASGVGAAIDRKVSAAFRLRSRASAWNETEQVRSQANAVPLNPGADERRDLFGALWN